MTTNNQDSLACRKVEVRKAGHAARKSQTDKDEASNKIIKTLVGLPVYQNAESVLWYVDVRDEVRTRCALDGEFSSGKKLVIPYCEDSDLELFHLESMSELTTGKYGILEPADELRRVPAKKVSIAELDLILVPGVGFDGNGGRIGHGKGYYDRLLATARPTSQLIGLAFECQMFAEIPMQSHDFSMDAVITEKQIYRRQVCSETSLDQDR